MRLRSIPLPSTVGHILMVALVFFMGLGIPIASISAALVLLAMAAFEGQYFQSINARSWTRSLLLFCFVIDYYLTLLSFRFVGLYEFLKLSILAMIAYSVGYALARTGSDKADRQTCWLLWSLAAGVVALALASAIRAGFPLKFWLLPGGFAANVWTGAEMHKTHLGMFSSLGMCLIGAVALARRSSLETRLLGWACALAVLAGFAVNVASQNRTPIVALLSTVLVCGFIKLKSLDRRTFSLGRILGASAALILLTMVVAGLSIQFSDVLRDTVFQRFNERSLETPRFKLWGMMISGFMDYPLGGRALPIPENFIHNTWLDVLYDAGLAPFILLLIFHAVHVPHFVRAVKRSGNEWLRFMFLGLGISFFVSMFAEPVMAASEVLFPMSLFLLGCVARVSDELRGQVEPSPVLRRHGVRAYGHRVL